MVVYYIYDKIQPRLHVCMYTHTHTHTHTHTRAHTHTRTCTHTHTRAYTHTYTLVTHASLTQSPILYLCPYGKLYTYTELQEYCHTVVWEIFVLKTLCTALVFKIFIVLGED